MYSTRLKQLLVAVLLCASTHSALAESEILSAAKGAWSRVTARERAPASGPQNDSWGEDSPVVRPRSDERAVDERSRDERKLDPRLDPPPPAIPSPVPYERHGRTAEDRLYGIREEVEEAFVPGRAASCTNVSRAWEGAAALASRGDEDRAYDAYLRLFSSCTDEQELIGTAYQAQKNLSAKLLEELMKEPVMAAPALERAMLTMKLQRMYAANKARKYDEAVAVSREIREALLESRDPGALEVSGWLEQRARNPKAAEKLFRAALRVDRDLESAREGLVYALLASGKTEAADREAERLDGSAADIVRADVLLARARESLKEDDFKQSLKFLDQADRLGLENDDTVLETRAWALKGAGDVKKAAKIFADLVESSPHNASLQQGYVDSLFAARDNKTLRALSEEETELGAVAREAVARQYDSQGRRAQAAELRGEVSEGNRGSFSAGVGLRNKSGSEGEGRLTQTTIPMGEAKAQIGDVSVELQAQRVSLDDGVHNATGEELRARATWALGDLEWTGGMGLSRSEGQSKYTWEARAKIFTDSGFFEAGVSRVPVMDSLRSYAGANIEVALPMEEGQEEPSFETVRTGRVFDTSAYITGSTLLDTTHNYRLGWTLGGGSVSGPNNYNNGYYRLSVNATKDFQSEHFSWLSAGPYVSVQSYDEDQNRFEGNWAGYFSPTADTGLGMLVNAMSLEGQTTMFRTSTKLGYSSRGLYYGNDSGVSLETDGEIAWLVHPSIILGVGAYVRTSPGYNDLALRLGFTIPFESRTGLYRSDLINFKAQ